MADLIINTNRQAMQFTIFSTKWMQIADAINNEAHRGCTVFDGVGWYSKRPVKMLLVMCRKIESVGIFRIIKTIDPDAIVTQTNVNGVYGQGFDRIKVKIPKHRSPLRRRSPPDRHGSRLAPYHQLRSHLPHRTARSESVLLIFRNHA